MKNNPETDTPESMTKEEAEAVLRRLGLGTVLDEPDSEMSKYYVTNTFTEYGDPLAPFRKNPALFRDERLQRELERADENPDTPNPDEQPK